MKARGPSIIENVASHGKFEDHIHVVFVVKIAIEPYNVWMLQLNYHGNLAPKKIK